MISNERLAKDDALAMSNARCSHFANGQSLMHGALLIVNRKLLNGYIN